MLLPCCHLHTLSLPFPSISSEKNQSWTYGEGCPRDRMGFWSGQGSCIPCTSPHSLDHHLILVHRCDVFNLYILLSLLGQPPFLPHKKDSGPFLDKFWRLTQHIQNIFEPEWIHKTFLEAEILQASRSLQVSLKYAMKITVPNNNLLLPVPLYHFRLCKNICVSANTPNHCSFCFVWHSSAHSHRGKKKGNCSENTWPGDRHGTATWWQQAPSTRVSWCHCQQHNQGLPLPFSKCTLPQSGVICLTTQAHCKL